MNLAIHAIMDELDFDPRRALDIGRDIGVEAFGLRMMNEHRYPRVPESEQRWLETLHDGGHCRFDVITPGFNKHPFDEGEIDKLIREDLSLSIRCAKRLGVDEISLFSWAKPTTAAPPPSMDAPSASMPFDPMVRAFRAMAEAAAREDLRLSIEVGYQCWGDTGLNVARLIRAADHPALGLLWDPCNSINGRLWWQTIKPGAFEVDDPMPILLAELEEVADLIVGVHVRDMHIGPPPNWQYALPGEGDIDWVRLIRALRDKGYSGALTIEHHIQPPEREKAARHTMHYLQKVLSANHS